MADRYFRLVAVPVSLLVTLTTTGFAQESTSGQSAAYNPSDVDEPVWVDLGAVVQRRVRTQGYGKSHDWSVL